jgi:hypothetical protein
VTTNHITLILGDGGLLPLEPFPGPKAWRLTKCLRCGCEAHYRFEYTLELNKVGEPTCRACHWRAWAKSTRSTQGLFARRDVVPEARARAHADQHEFDYLEALTDPSLHDDPHRVRCRHCGRISASRLGDIAWGCTCQTNQRRAAQTTNVSGPRRPELLKDSGLDLVACRRRRGVLHRRRLGGLQRGRQPQLDELALLVRNGGEPLVGRDRLPLVQPLVRAVGVVVRDPRINRRLRLAEGREGVGDG